MTAELHAISKGTFIGTEKGRVYTYVTTNDKICIACWRVVFSIHNKISHYATLLCYDCYKSIELLADYHDYKHAFCRMLFSYSLYVYLILSIPDYCYYHHRCNLNILSCN